MRTPSRLLLLSLCLALPAQVFAEETLEGSYALRGEESGGHPHAVRLVVKQTGDGRYRLERSSRCGATTSSFVGVGRRVASRFGPRLEGRFARSGSTAQAAVGLYQLLSGGQVLGVFRGPSCRGGTAWSVERTGGSGSSAAPTQPASSSLFPVRISAAVGRGGKNEPEDVRKIQDALVAKGFLRAGQFRRGVSDAVTVAAIERFQRERAGFRTPDGRVDVDKRTIKALNGQERPRADDPPPAPASRGRAASRSVAPTVARGIDGAASKGLTASQAYAELDRLGVSYKRVRDSIGVSDPVRLELPLLGVDVRYFSHSRSRPLTIDARLAVGLAHLAQYVKAKGVVRIVHLGFHVWVRRGKQTTGGHARGVSADIKGFVFRDGREIDLLRDWKTGRSNSRRGDGVRGVVVPTAADRAAMQSNERFLRDVWGFLVSEFDVVVTPSHNREHWNHFHAEVRSTSRQRARSRASFRAHDHGG